MVVREYRGYRKRLTTLMLLLRGGKALVSLYSRALLAMIIKALIISRRRRQRRRRRHVRRTLSYAILLGFCLISMTRRRRGIRSKHGKSGKRRSRLKRTNSEYAQEEQTLSELLKS